ncbi:hypothetical protein [Sphaerisporangium flaviroseum]
MPASLMNSREAASRLVTPSATSSSTCTSRGLNAPALQDRMIREADALTPDNRFDVRTVRTSHAPTLSGRREIVKILHGLAP